MKCWKIKLNIAKSVCVDFALCNYAYTPVTIDGISILQCQVYLGIHIDKKLLWENPQTQKKRRTQCQISKNILDI